MKFFGRKSAGRAPARPAFDVVRLARGLGGNGVIGDWPRAYEAQVRSAYLDNAIAQRAVRLVAEGVAAVPLAASDDAALGLVTATSGGQALLESVAVHLLLHGNAFIELLPSEGGAPSELYALRPERVTVEADARGWPVAFAYKAGSVTTRLTPDALIHIRQTHPLDDHYGLGCLGAASGAVAVHNAAARWNKALLDNAARPSGALVHEASEALSADQFERLKTELEDGFQGALNAGRPMLLEGGLRWQSLSLSPADMDFVGLKAAAAREIALAFGVPPMLLGLPGDATYANYREANKALWRLAILPLAGKILAAITQGLRPWFADLRLSVDLDQVSALSEDRERLWAQVSAADFLTLNEKRALVGFQPVEVDGGEPASSEEVKYNHCHDPANGEFASGSQGCTSRAAVLMAKKPRSDDRASAQSGRQQPVIFRPSVAPKSPPDNSQRLSKNGASLLAEFEGFRDKPYFPGNERSGVTIGYGYDIGERPSRAIVADLTAVGVDRKIAIAFADGRQLRGSDAQRFVAAFSQDIQITEIQARDLLQIDSQARARNITKLVKAPLSQNQLDALISLDYNVGLDRKSSIVRVLNSQSKTKYTDAANLFLLYNKEKKKGKNGKLLFDVSVGLTTRRSKEKLLFLTL
jgi:HK97 family phage portal protein